MLGDKNDFWPDLDEAGPVSLECGKRYGFSDGNGSVLVECKVAPASRSFWAIVDRPGYKYNGERAPFFWNGRYAGVMSWVLPDLTTVIGEEVEVEERDFDG